MTEQRALLVKITETREPRRTFGPYFKPNDVLYDASMADLETHSGWRMLVQLNGGRRKNPETGATIILTWRGELRRAWWYLGPIIKKWCFS
jgi:hypothetical protein